MSSDNIIDRIHKLDCVLAYEATLEKKHFTPGERICINQERGSLYEQINENNSNPRRYKVSASIENRIQFILNKINNIKVNEPQILKS